MNRASVLVLTFGALGYVYEGSKHMQAGLNRVASHGPRRPSSSMKFGRTMSNLELEMVSFLIHTNM